MFVCRAEILGMHSHYEELCDVLLVRLIPMGKIICVMFLGVIQHYLCVSTLQILKFGHIVLCKVLCVECDLESNNFVIVGQKDKLVKT